MTLQYPLQKFEQYFILIRECTDVSLIVFRATEVFFLYGLELEVSCLMF